MGGGGGRETRPHSVCLTKGEETGPGSPPPNPPAASPQPWGAELSHSAMQPGRSTWVLGCPRGGGSHSCRTSGTERAGETGVGGWLTKGCNHRTPLCLPWWGSQHITHSICARYLMVTRVQERHSQVTNKETEAQFPCLSHQARTGGGGGGQRDAIRFNC